MDPENIDDVWQTILRKQRGGERLNTIESEISLALDTDFELTSGGVSGYLRSNAANRLSAAAALFRKLKADATASMLEELKSLYPDGKPGDSPLAREKQQKVMSKEQLNKLLQERDYDEEGMTLRAVLWDYWSANRSRKPK